ncbi:hypothetical protein BJ875DRAFT_460809 [Amylocarpus encephaloides]|uniref:Zn(2)-C6 fungal-type domain-containing protein n=1 Tax=Amylocarpus encephaloides TaxID=45428 RepID=A0A9P8C612_9HELO|nr:hypothetical protein BJ875DRAFT_460809 [Amylocarpus encephaloides]
MESNINATSATRTNQLEREVIQLTRRAHLLEDFLLQNNRDVSLHSLGQRRMKMLHRIEVMEDKVSKNGLVEEARRYLGDDDFMRTSINPPKRPSDLGEDLQPNKRMKIALDSKLPCLRCKILKKRCDVLLPCAHCPQQGLDIEADYWKVLGCIRSPLREMASHFCPDFARSDKRVLRCPSGNLHVDFVLTKSRVSTGKKNRIMNLIWDRNDFANLYDSSWEDLANRQSLAQHAAIQKPELPEEFTHSAILLSPDPFEAPWALLQVVVMDASYGLTTEYNPFTLLRLGNAFWTASPASWDLYLKSKRLLRQAVELYLLERLCGHIVSGDIKGSPPFDPAKLPSSHSLILVDIKPDIEEFFESFERICSGRAKLTGTSQMACFYALLVFSIVKGLLIDGYSVRRTCDDVDPWNDKYLLCMNSMFKVLVSIFCWSSKSDVMLQDDSTGSDTENEEFKASRNLVKVDLWKERGFNSTRDFLVGLGSFVLPGNTYNGFFRQLYAFDRLPSFVPRSPGHLSQSGFEVFSKDQVPQGEAVSDLQYTAQSFTVRTLAVPTIAVRVAEGRAHSPRTLSPEPHRPTSAHSRFSRSSSPSNGSETGTSRASRFTFITEDNCRDGHKSKRLNGGRRGALDEATLKKARDVRKIGACWNCWVMKAPCSQGHPCDRCKPKSSSEKSGQCNRAPFTSSVSLFFPELLCSRFTTESTDRYIHQNVSGFTDQYLLVNIAWFGIPAFETNATPFTPTPDSQAQTKYDARSRETLGVASLPVGLSPLDTHGSREACLQHLELLLNNPSNSNLLSNTRTSMIAKEVLQAIFSFYHSKEEKDDLLHDTLLLHLTFNLIGKPVMFTDTSAAMIIEKIEGDHLNFKFFSSRLLDRQIKEILYLHSRWILSRLLANLEKAIRGRKSYSWPVIFSTIVILCLSIELLQAEVAFIMSGITLESGPVAPRREIANGICEALEDGPFEQLSHLFHTIFRTTQKGKGLNPFDKTPKENLTHSFDTQELAMIDNIQSVVNKGAGLANTPMPDFDIGLDNFTKLNSGRLVSKFLSPFSGQDRGKD